MKISSTASDDIQVVHVDGAVTTIEDCDQIWRVMRGLLTREHRQIVLDLTACPAVAEDIRRHWSQNLLQVSDNYHGKAVILNPPDDLTEWMERAGAKPLTPWFYKLEEAVAACRHATGTS